MEKDSAALASQLHALEDPALPVYPVFLPNEDHASAAHPAIKRVLRFLHPQ